LELSDGTRYKGHPKGAAGKGGTPVPSPHSRAGKKNVMSQQVKEIIADAFEKLGGLPGLIKWAQKNNDNMTAFYTRIWVKLLPMRINIDRSGDQYLTPEQMREELIARGLAPFLDLKPVDQSNGGQPEEKEIHQG